MAKIRAILILLQMGITISLTIIFMYIFKKHNHKVRKIWSALQIKLMGVKLEIEGKIDNDADMVIINHQSMLDIILYEYLTSRDVAWIAKKEIDNIPWFGHIIKAPKMITVERESKKSLVKLLKDVKDRLSYKRQLAIFPEGTRTDGKKLKKFKSGAKVIAEKFNLNVQPIVFIGTIDVFDSKKILQSSGTIKVVYLPTIKANKSSNWYEETEAKMKEILKKEVYK